MLPAAVLPRGGLPGLAWQKVAVGEKGVFLIMGLFSFVFLAFCRPHGFYLALVKQMRAHYKCKQPFPAVADHSLWLRLWVLRSLLRAWLSITNGVCCLPLLLREEVSIPTPLRILYKTRYVKGGARSPWGRMHCGNSGSFLPVERDWPPEVSVWGKAWVGCGAQQCPSLFGHL